MYNYFSAVREDAHIFLADDWSFSASDFCDETGKLDREALLRDLLQRMTNADSVTGGEDGYASAEEACDMLAGNESLAAIAISADSGKTVFCDSAGPLQRSDCLIRRYVLPQILFELVYGECPEKIEEEA